MTTKPSNTWMHGIRDGQPTLKNQSVRECAIPYLLNIIVKQIYILTLFYVGAVVLLLTTHFEVYLWFSGLKWLGCVDLKGLLFNLCFLEICCHEVQIDVMCL